MRSIFLFCSRRPVGGVRWIAMIRIDASHSEAATEEPQFHLRRARQVRNGSLRQPAWRNWQTRWTQNPVIARSCGFDPLRRQFYPCVSIAEIIGKMSGPVACAFHVKSLSSRLLCLLALLLLLHCC